MSTFVMSAPVSSLMRRAASSTAFGPALQVAVGISTFTAARSATRLTAFPNSSMASIVNSFSSSIPRNVRLTLSPTDSRSTSARSRMRAICTS